MNLGQLLLLRAVSGGEPVPETGYTHTNVKKLTFNGNPYAWMTAHIADKPNLITLPEIDKTAVGVRFVSHDNIVTFNGEASKVDDLSLTVIRQDFPAGTYVASYYPYAGVSGPDTGKNMYFDFFNDEDASAYVQRVRFDAVKDTVVTRQFTLSENMKKLRIWVGVRAVVYEDYRLFITMFPSDVLVGDFGETVPEDGTYTHTFGGTVPFVYTMQHTSTVYR